MSLNTMINVAEMEKAIDGYKSGNLTKQECMYRLAEIFQELEKDQK